MWGFWASTGYFRGGLTSSLVNPLHRGIMLGVLLMALAGPAGAANTNLTATAHYTASSEWESDKGNTTFVAAKAFDGDRATRWNVAGGDNQNSWIAAIWNSPVTINKVIMREAFDRLSGFRIQRLDMTRSLWVDAGVVEGGRYAAVKRGDPENPTFVVRLEPPIRTPGLRVLFTQVNSAPSIFEVEAYNNPAGTLSGRVTDARGQPVAEATVRAGDETATTDSGGRYTLAVDAGRYTVLAGKAGVFRDRVARDVELTANAAVVRDFVLHPMPLNLALSATPVSSTDWEAGTDYDAAKGNDGRLNTRWNSHASDANGAYLELQWGQPRTFNRVVIRQAFDRIRNYTLMRYDEVSDLYIPIQNADVARGRSADPVLTHVFPSPVTSRRLRLVVNLTDAVPSIYELEVSSTPVAVVKGLVKDVVTGSPVRRATIVSDADGALGLADDRGEFQLLVEPGDYLLQAYAEGYFSGAPAAVVVNAGETGEVELTAAPLGANVAGAARASASSEAAGGENGAARVNDGNPGTFWLARGYANQWVSLTWETPVHVTAIHLRGFHGVIQRSFLQVLAADGKSWVELPETSFSPQFLGNRPADFLFPRGIDTKGVRYFITATHSTTDIPGLGEILVFDSTAAAP